MGCNPESGEIRELMSENDLIKPEVLFKYHEVITIKDCDFRIIQICGSPHNTITLQSIENSFENKARESQVNKIMEDFKKSAERTKNGNA